MAAGPAGVGHGPRRVDAATFENLVTTTWNKGQAEIYAADLDGVRAR